MRFLPVVAAASLTAALFASSVLADGLLSGVDGMTSTVMQHGQSSFSGLAMRARLHPASLSSQIEILPTVEYWRNSSSVEPYNIHSSRSDATLGVAGRFVFQTHGWEPYAGLGLALHFLSEEVEAAALGVPKAQASSVKGGVSFLGGLSIPLTQKVDNFFELNFHDLPGSSQLKLNFGLSYNLK
jgi:hypothetical protein